MRVDTYTSSFRRMPESTRKQKRIPASAGMTGASGFTLIELIVFIVIVSIALTGLISVFNQSLSKSVDPIVQIRALECAQAKMDEILARKFADNTPVGGTPACGSAESGPIACTAISLDTALDDVGDYHFAAADTSKANCSISVAVVDAGADLGIAANQARKITVTASSDGGGQVVLAAYKVNF
jgi:MSHA pilin protein MshD